VIQADRHAGPGLDEGARGRPVTACITGVV
jgi:hypothetical protein